MTVLLWQGGVIVPMVNGSTGEAPKRVPAGDLALSTPDTAAPEAALAGDLVLCRLVPGSARLSRAEPIANAPSLKNWD